jgi:hypothetical protein
MSLERTMQFIVDNLAAVTVRQQQNEEIINRLVARDEKAEARQQKVEARQEKVEDRLTRMDRQIGGLQKLVKIGMRMMVDLGAAQKKTNQALTELAVVQKRTDLKFDRWIESMNKGGNGHKKRSN